MTLTAAMLWDLLGYSNGRDQGALLRRAAAFLEQNVYVHHLTLCRGTRQVPTVLLTPYAATDKPAVLYAHAHGNAHHIGKSEVLDGRPALQDPPLGLALAQAGHPVLCPDLPGFGARQCEGREDALAKAALWQGRCLLGDMLADLSAVLDVMGALPDTCGRPVVTLGISMGGTLAYWLGALDPRVAAVCHMCVLANMDGLIRAGAHDLHGPYMTVPGLLQQADMGDVAALVAPRPHLVTAGLRDPLTPPEALNAALHRLRSAYKDTPDALSEVLEPEAGHEETASMRQAVLRFISNL